MRRKPHKVGSKMAVDLSSPGGFSQDSVFGDLDCNDNTPVLQPQTLHAYSKTQLNPDEMSATRCHLMSSFASPSHSNVSDVSSAGHQMVPDDALNNDFFYEDEFAVQFDMQLTAGDADHDALLSVSQLCYGDGGATLWWSHLAGSKSDSCLYELELDRSGSSGQYSSQELSLSDHNTSDVSDLPSEPLFASPLVQDSGSSLGNARYAHGELSGSFRNDDGRYEYDWRANKDQYTLSFDQTPARTSSGDSSCGQDSDCLSATTSWAERACSATSGSPRYMSWADRSASSSSDPERAPPNAVLTSWKQLKEGSSSDEGEGGSRGLTSWQQTGRGNRSRSLPDLKSRQRRYATQTVSCGDSGDKESSLSLFELFQKLRSQSDDDGSVTDVVVSPNTLRRLTGTWSMSAASLGASTPSDHVTSQCAEVAVGQLIDCGDSDDDTSHKTLMSWKTFTDVSNDALSPGASGTRCGKRVQVEDCSIQTSLEERKLTTMDRSLQTSLEMQHHGTSDRKRGDTVAQGSAVVKSAGSLHGLRSQLSSSVFETCSPLPDLSFLNPPMSHSAAGERAPSAAGRREYGGRMKGMGTDSVMQRLCRMTSAISKLNDEGGHVQRGRARSNESASTNSCCSSSSSGIDPGSYHEAQNSSRTAAYISDNASRFGAKSEPVLDDSHEHNSCENCRRIKAILAPEMDASVASGDSKQMMASHPCYSQPSAARRKGTLKQVDYLQVSPTHWPRSATYLLVSDSETRCSEGKVGMLVPVVSGSGVCKEGRLHCVRRRHAAGSNGKVRDAELQLIKRPLKSCLVKRRKRDRDRDKAVALKHRSWSHPQDALVLKYSQDGETQYQLVTAGQTVTTMPTDIQQTSLPADALQSHIEAQYGPNEAVSMPTDNMVRSIEKEAVKSPLGALQLMSKSSEAIPVPPCTCGTACAVLHSSSESNESTTSESGRQKKCVSFAEKVSYASPYCSPHLSPQKKSCKVAAMATSREEQLICIGADDAVDMPSWKTLNFQTVVPSHLPLRKPPNSDSDSSQESAPHEFMVSPPPPRGVTACPVAGAWESSEVGQKRELVLGVLKASEQLLEHFGQTRDITDKVMLGDSSQHPEVCHLVLAHVCPAVHAVMVDGLRPHVRSLFGQVKNNVWKVVQETTELGPSTRVLHDLVQHLKRHHFLNTVSLKFNAFIFGLLNYKALDFWLGHVMAHESLVLKHYLPGSFLRLTASQPVRRLALDMTTALQPLSQISFQLEYNFEYRIICDRKCPTMSEGLLQKEATGGAEAEAKRRDRAHNDPQSQSASWHQQLKRTTGEQWVVGRQGAPLWGSTAAHLVGRLHESWSVDDLAHKVKRTFLSLPVTMTSVPELIGINDSVGDASGVDTGVSDEAASLGGQHMLAETVIRNNEVLGVDEGGAIEDGAPREENGLLSQWGRQLIQELNPPKKVYKKGITEYAFDSEMDPVNDLVVLPAGSSTSAVQTNVESKNVSIEKDSENLVGDGDGSTKGADSTPTDFTIPPGQSLDGSAQTDHSSVSSSGSDTAPTSFRIPSSKSEGSMTMAASLSHALTSPTAQALKGSVRKRLSGLGSSLINVFDKLLLDESKVRKERSVGGKMTGQSDVTMDSVIRDKDSRTQVSQVESTLTVSDTETRGVTDQSVVKLSGGHCCVDDQSTSEPTLRRVRALCYYISNDNEHLSFDKGSEMTVIGQVDHDWLLCRQSNSEGLVYAACVESVAFIR